MAKDLAFQMAMALYQRFDDPNSGSEIWKLHVSPNEVIGILNHFHPHSSDTAGAIGAHSGVRATYNKVKVVNKYFNIQLTSDFNSDM